MCVFCKIIKGELLSEKVMESDYYLAFRPLQTHAPVHILCIPKEHVDKKDSISGKTQIWDGLFAFGYEIIKKYGLDKTGYRIVNNGAGYHGVDHEHIHILGGSGWFPDDGL